MIRNNRFLSVLALVAAFEPLFAAAATPAVRVPSSWYVLPEDQPSGNLSYQLASPQSSDAEDSLARLLDRTLRVHGETLGKMGAFSYNALQAPPPGKPKDWVPWHLAYFATDLAVSAQGLIGLLTVRGTPGVQIYWRRQNRGPRLAANHAETLRTADNEEPELIAFGPESSEVEIMRQIEPAVRAAVASGRVQDGNRMRQELRMKAGEFQAIVAALDTPSSGEWWVSGFRVDLNVEATGQVVAAPLIMAGGDVRLRFDWRRMMRNGKPVSRPSPRAPLVSERSERVRAFAMALAQDLEAFSSDLDEKGTGFYAHAFRVGIGASVRGDIGVVRGSASVLGHLNFTRDVRPPQVRPKSGLELASMAGDDLLILEDGLNAGRHAFARREGIAFDVLRESNSRQTVYRVDRKRFRKGLKKAAKIASFFAKRGAKAKSSSWRLYEMRLNFDASVSGDVGLASLGGLVATQVSLFNGNF